MKKETGDKHLTVTTKVASEIEIWKQARHGKWEQFSSAGNWGIRIIYYISI